MVERPHPVYDVLVREFYANFNSDIDTPRSEHQHFHWNEVGEVLLWRENAWPLQTDEWLQIELVALIVILWLPQH